MELIIQKPLFPDIEPVISWVMLPQDTWSEWQYPDDVNRRTENSAFYTLKYQSKFFNSFRPVSLSPLHHRIRRLEIELMQRHPHYDEQDVQNAIADKLHLTAKRIKKILFDTSVIYNLLVAAGLESLTEIT